MSNILADFPVTVCMMDDVLVNGASVQELDQLLTTVLDTLRNSGITLNKDKCQFSKHSVQFLGHFIDRDGIRPDPSKVTATLVIKEPTNVKELRCLLGMAIHLGKFIPNLADTTKSLHDLQSKKNHWTWGEPQQTTFFKLKEQLTATPVLVIYDPCNATIVSANASSYGLEAVLLQKARWKLPTSGICVTSSF